VIGERDITVPPFESETSSELDRLLELIDRRGLSILELRLLLQLEEGTATIPELAEILDRDPSDVLAAGRRLADLGLARRRAIGRERQGLYGIARPGLIALRPLLTAAGRSADHGS
jgi:predicted transcriptional regulator